MLELTGKELIEWIHANHAEDLQVLVEHRDGGGSYHTAERVGEFQEVALCEFADESYGEIRTIKRQTETPTAIIL